jgi:hypothetical protein
MADRTLRVDAWSARQVRRGHGRFGEERFGIDGDQHRFVAQSRRNVGRLQAISKEFTERSKTVAEESRMQSPRCITS